VRYSYLEDPNRAYPNTYCKTSPLTHATLLKGSATLQNLCIPIFLSKTIDFPTFKTQFLLPSELEVDLFAVLPLFLKRIFF